MAGKSILIIIGLLSSHQVYTLSASSSPTNEDIQELSNTIEHVKRDSIALIGQLKNELNQLRRDMLPPVGSTYVQYGGQKQPNDIWPAARWENVSKTYAGLFFRAEGGFGSSFGETQGSQVRLERQLSSKWVTSGGHGGYTKRILEEFYSTGDVRPANQAMRIWLRTN